MSRSQEDFGRRAVEGASDWRPDEAAGKEAVEDMMAGLAERDSAVVEDLGKVLDGEPGFRPGWMKDGSEGIESVNDVVEVYAEKSDNWSDEQREYVARGMSDILVEPASAFLKGMEGTGAEDFRTAAVGELEQARAAYEDAMMSGDRGKGRMARAMLNQVQKDAEGVSRGERI